MYGQNIKRKRKSFPRFAAKKVTIPKRLSSFCDFSPKKPVNLYIFDITVCMAPTETSIENSSEDDSSNKNKKEKVYGIPIPEVVKVVLVELDCW